MTCPLSGRERGSGGEDPGTSSPSPTSTQDVRMRQPITMSRLVSSNMTFLPLCIAATVMHSATEWL